MTFSILARDPVTGHMGGAAATGSLCVGGWVLRGDPRAGMSASQGAAPSTFWGEDVLQMMRTGRSASDAVSAVVCDDQGRESRQLAALGKDGMGAVFTGKANTRETAGIAENGLVAAGNLLQSAGVIDALVTGYSTSDGPLPDKLLGALKHGAQAGGDRRGLLSAALLMIGEDIPPLSLRVDFSERSIEDLTTLLNRTRESDYAAWLNTVPVLTDIDRY